MIWGGFDNYRRPTIAAEGTLRLFPGHAVIRFLLDTGASNTFIMSGDASRFAVDYTRLPAPSHNPIGGSSIPAHPIDITMDLIDAGVLYSYDCSVLIVDPLICNARHPSILGQNVWHRWGLFIDSSTVRIDLTHPDRRIP
jgi:hypothetical protein